MVYKACVVSLITYGIIIFICRTFNALPIELRYEKLGNFELALNMANAINCGLNENSIIVIIYISRCIWYLIVNLLIIQYLNITHTNTS